MVAELGGLYLSFASHWFSGDSKRVRVPSSSRAQDTRTACAGLADPGRKRVAVQCP